MRGNFQNYCPIFFSVSYIITLLAWLACRAEDAGKARGVEKNKSSFSSVTMSSCPSITLFGTHQYACTFNDFLENYEKIFKKDVLIDLVRQLSSIYVMTKSHCFLCFIFNFVALERPIESPNDLHCQELSNYEFELSKSSIILS